ncbi:unnamed protein product [Moneuplotes crassus]|uniref:Uncharacterized protein n=1 Tax=Euplotes crassus TaxID=5936 RepID=A0AAD2D8N7_EUPCR|nr:unnamed protein product [Moneuplotes crassus]
MLSLSTTKRKKPEQKDCSSSTRTGITREKKADLTVNKTAAPKKLKNGSTKDLLNTRKSFEYKGSMTQRKTKSRTSELYNSSLKSPRKSTQQKLQKSPKPQKSMKVEKKFENEESTEIVPFPSFKGGEESRVQTLHSDMDCVHNSPDFKINLTDKSNTIIKDSNKSLKMDSIEEEKFGNITTKDSNFIHIGSTEISPHESFSREPEGRIRPAPEVTCSPQEEEDREKAITLQIELAEKTNENNRLHDQNKSLQQQMAQYEEMLSKMNHEYEKILSEKLKDSLRSTESEKQILSLTQQLTNIENTTEHRISSLDSQLKEAQRDLEVKNQVIETSKKTISDLEAEITANLNQSLHINKNEVELRQKIDEQNTKIVKLEAIIRENKEQFYIINTENANLKSDIQSLTSLEKALRSENSSLTEQRQELENTLQMVKGKISQDSLKLRKYDSEIEAMNRQIMRMQNSINLSNREVEDLQSESNMLKQTINNKEKENILLKKALDMKCMELKTTQQNLNRSNSLLEAHKSKPEYYGPDQNEKEHNSSMRMDRTPQCSSFYRKAHNKNSIESMLSPYASPISSFRKQNQSFRSNLSNSSFAARDISAPPQPLKPLTPMKASNEHYRETSPISESFTGIDDGSYEFVHSQLKSMTLEKKRLENEYSRLPIVIDKSPSIKRRKEFLENQLTLLEKNIDSYTVRLRELNS